jgi:hypothetical protein
MITLILVGFVLLLYCFYVTIESLEVYFYYDDYFNIAKLSMFYIIALLMIGVGFFHG